MAVNPRIYYPIHAVAFAPIGVNAASATGYRAAKGVQSVGLTTNFSLEQVYQLGQLSLYENIENLPEVEITVEKVLDGYSLIQHLATPGATSSSLAGRFNDNQCMMMIAFYSTSQEAAIGTPLSYVQLSGVFVSSLGFNLPVEGNCTESVTLTCRDKIWGSASSGSPFASGAFRTFGFTGNDSPILASGGVQRRENVVMGSGANCSRWPKAIAGIDTISGFNPAVGNSYSAHIQNVTVNVSLGRTDLFELGRKGPYFRFANFPTEVTTSISLTATEDGDNIDALQDQDNLTDETIFIVLTNGVTIDLGTKNKLSSVTFTGGDTGGGNKEVTYNYSNFNDFRTRMPVTDPAGL